MRVVSTTINTGEIVLQVTDPAFILDAAKLRRLVFDGGATLHQVHLEGAATLTDRKGAQGLTFCGSGQWLALAGAFPGNAGREYVVKGVLEIPRGTAPFEPLVKVESLSALSD